MSAVIPLENSQDQSIVNSEGRFNQQSIPKFSPTYSEDLVYSWAYIQREFSKQPLYLTANIDLFFIRHGKTRYNTGNKVSGSHNTQLSDVGRREAEQVANRLRKKCITAVFSSDLDRAFDTAKIFQETARITSPIIKDYRLREINLGDLEGKRRGYVKPFAMGDIDYKPKGGESYREAALRIASFLVDLAHWYQGQIEETAIAIFTHAGVMRVLGSFFGSVKDIKDVFRQDFANAQMIETNLSKLEIPVFWQVTNK